MSHILDRFTHTPPLPLEKDSNGTLYPRKFGQSLFREVPLSRDCSNSGIKDEYCPCVVPQKIDSNDTRLVGAAEASVKYINTFLSAEAQCVPLRLSHVNSGAVTKQTAGVTSLYVVSFTTEPGDFLFESNVKYSSSGSPGQGSFQVGPEILRMNKMSKPDYSCIRHAWLEKFCYCKNSVL